MKRPKKGTPFQQVVAEVLRVMDPGTTVKEGNWLVGPDGRRELDVHIIGTCEGQQRKVLIECKDFNPSTTGPVGIGYVDALESKSRDLGFHFAAICSNAGFTEGAVRKSSRVGIGLISVMKKGDKRLRFSVSEEIYTRKVTVKELKISLEGRDPISLAGVKFEEVLYQGIPVANWVMRRASLIIGANPIVAGSYTAKHRLTQELELQLPDRVVQANVLIFHMTISGGWFEHQVTLDATQAVYDWLRHRVRLAPIPGQLLIQGVDIHAGTPVQEPPARELLPKSSLGPGETLVSLLLLSGLGNDEPLPNLDKYVSPEDQNYIMTHLPPDSYRSTGA